MNFSTETAIINTYLLNKRLGILKDLELLRKKDKMCPLHSIVLVNISKKGNLFTNRIADLRYVKYD